MSSGQASKLVTKLETELGVQLLKRTTRALSPTEMGSTFYQQIKGILRDFDQLHASVRGFADQPRGRIHLAAPSTFGTTQLMPELLDFSRLYPDIELDVDLSDRVVNLVEEGFDAAIRIGKPADSSLVTRRLCEMRIVLAASPSYIKANGMPTAVADLADHQCIIDTNFKDAEAWSFKESAVRPVTSVTVRGRFRLSNAEACLAAAREGLGIARLPSFVAGPCFQDGSLVPVLNDFEEPPGSLLALYPPARYLAPKVRALIDFLGARYRGVPNWDRAWIGGR